MWCDLPLAYWAGSTVLVQYTRVWPDISVLGRQYTRVWPDIVLDRQYTRVCLTLAYWTGNILVVWHHIKVLNEQCTRVWLHINVLNRQYTRVWPEINVLGRQYISVWSTSVSWTRNTLVE